MTRGETCWTGTTVPCVSVFMQHNGREINHEGDGFFVSFADSFDAVECAIAIQRTLADHRREHGFAPQVRIGVHATEAVDLGDDYLGKGVHEAARVGAAAGAGEILVTAAVIDSVTDHCHVRNRRELDLKGLSVALDVGKRRVA